MIRSFGALRRLSDPSHGSQGIPLNDSVSHHELSSTKSLTGWNDTVDAPLIASTQEPCAAAYDGSASATASVNSPPAEQSVLQPKFGPSAVIMLLLALYSTTLSGLWLVVAIIQPRWGFLISTTHGLSPSSAATLTALLGKTIEIVSVTVFISCIGQALTRRAAAEKSTGITLADITIRNWIIQPGFIFTHYKTLAIAGCTLFGALALLALVTTILYTTASEALVSPKLKYSQWETRELTAVVHSYYGNYVAAGIRCVRDAKLIQGAKDKSPGLFIDMAVLCLGHELNYQSTGDLIAFLRDDDPDAAIERTAKVNNIPRPALYTILHDKVTILATRVDTEFSDVASLYERWGRIIDNVTVSIPHPGVWSASRLPDNKILQPEDLSNTGSFSIKASVVSPTLNTLCVNMDEDELAPVVYTMFPHGGENGDFEIWALTETTQWNNSTVVDDVFRWGSKYGRRRPVFGALPESFRIVYHKPSPIGNTTDDAGYLLAHLGEPGAEYTLCQMRSWLSTDCSTHLDVFGLGKPIMRAHCGDDSDPYRYDPSVYKSSNSIKVLELWSVMLDAWREGVMLEQPSGDTIFGFAYILTSAILQDLVLDSKDYTISKFLSVMLLSTLSLSAVDTQLRHTWDHSQAEDFAMFDLSNLMSDLNATETFRAAVRSQEYTSGHTENWQRFFYLVLGITFALNLLCLVNLFRWFGLIDDITEPQNHFSLAMSSPQFSRMDASYPDGPEKQHWESSWRVSQSSVGDGYQFDDCKKDL
ncbi:hypothetical protein CDV31_015978 [Fusarium ambrosium]|uniref:Uncharacterized protein n=1 Tax=Fusarium ambrosium TaxID=131363 RepID=A0A428SGF9_9HYPO|nr:hypothetical protein CDV31_015978 [Fusarium ambrosium]